ncbi:2-keto-4-pentenoate hydratase [Salirhabdus sp. Marseille-P4669]|uniref:2-keto-4-pentenoate hydratase n=1 Tax=Salirhabdus sp. Marseille-P4669 TaxID=2042310 RepID=UPI000C7B66B4|nr:fumarylacetoacetate hydrolase family protein [Salirhabdus sp. Marseille-P4669]
MTGETKTIAEALFEADTTKSSIAPITASVSLSVKEAYQIQLENVKRKLSLGHRIVGKKIGLTSKAMQSMLGVNEPDYGHLLDSMALENGADVEVSTLLQPKVEGEIAFVLKEDVKGPHVTAMDILKATDYIVPAIEIVDSRIKDWKITLPDTIADNASSGLYVLGGKPTKVSDIDLELIGMVLMKNGEVANTGVGAAALGNPAVCVAWLANRLAEFNIALHAGEVILSGALSAAIEGQKGDQFTVKFAHLGEVSVRFV